VTPDHVDPIVDALLPVLHERCGIVTIGEVGVLNATHFVPELKDRPKVLHHL
jgi:hypothetical protein